MKKSVLALMSCFLVLGIFTFAGGARSDFSRIPKLKITDSKGKEFILEDVLVTFPYVGGDIVLPRPAFRCRIGDGESNLPFVDVNQLFYVRRYNEDYRIFQVNLCNGKIRDIQIRNDAISFVGKVSCLGREVEIDFKDVRRLMVMASDAE